MKLKKNKKIIIVLVVVAVLMFIIYCKTDISGFMPCEDDNYSDDHAVNVARCLQSLEDGSAYEIDDVLTATAPWKPSDIVVKFRDGEGGYIVRVFLGITKAGYYLVQDYSTGDIGRDWPPYKKNEYPSYDAERITNEQKATEPFALMSMCAVTDNKTNSLFKSEGMPYICGSFIRTIPRDLELGISVKGFLLDGAREGEWLRYDSYGNLFSKGTYKNGLRDGVFIAYTHGQQQPYFFAFYDNGREIFSLTFKSEGMVKSIPKEKQNSIFLNFDEHTQTIQYGYLVNNEKAGTWHKWGINGELIEEIDYDLLP